MAKRRRETVHLGVLYSLTGPYGLVGREMLNGLTLAVEEVNTSADFDFRFTPLSSSIPAANLQNYQEHCELLIRDKGVRHIVGCYTSASRKQVLPLIERYDRLLWHSARYEGFENSDNVIYIGAAPNQHIVPLARHMIENAGDPRLLCRRQLSLDLGNQPGAAGDRASGRRRDPRQAAGRAG